MSFGLMIKVDITYHMILITGKSSAIDRIKEFLTEHGYHVFAVPGSVSMKSVEFVY